MIDLSSLLTIGTETWFAVFLGVMNILLVFALADLRLEVRTLHRASRALGAEATRLKMLRSKRRRA